ncbi:hypothetical protein JIG36_47805 [Actinoplanes sp. LDG1-06]|uniref:Uncharacterized protein n=1 Tax=Paractinoplanes ovalisporus TaxID=2810368 RepID=A0ABS2AV39_9ACTN|nr:hypothetical protein [Actinoplanes ovalisporus]MBM2623228.1 hypothetical protein [Actinoplanes ovalisporus]
MADWLPIAGTLLGAVVGSTSTLLSQRLAFGRDRAAKLTDLRREAVTRFLSEIHKHQRELYSLHERYPDAATREGAIKRVSPIEAQVALDNVRFLATAEVVAQAESLWLHVRESNFARGNAKSRIRWRRVYWEMRKDLVFSFRASLET